MQHIVFRQPTTDDMEFWKTWGHLRHEIDEIDEELFNLLSNRMKAAERIGEYKSATTSPSCKLPAGTKS